MSAVLLVLDKRIPKTVSNGNKKSPRRDIEKWARQDSDLRLSDYK
jgi:hypothetical protein